MIKVGACFVLFLWIVRGHTSAALCWHLVLSDLPLRLVQRLNQLECDMAHLCWSRLDLAQTLAFATWSHRVSWETCLEPIVTGNWMISFLIGSILSFVIQSQIKVLMGAKLRCYLWCTLLWKVALVASLTDRLSSKYRDPIPHLILRLTVRLLPFI